MRKIVTYFFIGLIVAMMAACNGNAEDKTATAEAKPSVQEAHQTVAQPVPPADSMAIEATEPKEEAQVEGVLPKPNSEADAVASSRTPPANPGKAAPVRQAPSIKSNPQGYPTGYISRKDAALQHEAKDAAAKTHTFKIYEGVIILDTKMTDDTGQPTTIPTWYKVECVDKKQGWVKANCVTLN